MAKHFPISGFIRHLQELERSFGEDTRQLTENEMPQLAQEAGSAMLNDIAALLCLLTGSQILSPVSGEVALDRLLTNMRSGIADEFFYVQGDFTGMVSTLKLMWPEIQVTLVTQRLLS